jgi:hypothetical protein
MSGLFQWFEEGYTFHSGKVSNFKIECDALEPDDWTALARLIARSIDFGSVEGVPRGGLPLAEALTPYATSGKLLIIEDVWTTGASMERHRDGREAIGLAVFAYSRVAPWVTSIFRMESGWL